MCELLRQQRGAAQQPDEKDHRPRRALRVAVDCSRQRLGDDDRDHEHENDGYGQVQSDGDASHPSQAYVFTHRAQ